MSKLNNILSTFKKTVVKLEKFEAETTRNMEYNSLHVERLTEESRVLGGELARAIHVKTKINDMIGV